MRCSGITKSTKRCKNAARFLVCSKHWWQPFSGIVLLISTVGVWAGLFQDLIKPLTEWSARDSELKKPLAVEIKSNRRSTPEWLNDTDPKAGEPDIITILLDRRPVRTLEIYHSVKDQRYRDYLPTSPLTDFKIPTTAEYKIADLDGDKIPEIILLLSNQIYSLHPDMLISVLIFNPRGELIAKAPYPSKIEGLNVMELTPYSAFQSTGVMYDAITNTPEPISYANGFDILKRDKGYVLQFSWIVDNRSYVDQHLHQVQEMAFRNGRLEMLSETPSLYASPELNKTWENQAPLDIVAANAFLKANNSQSIQQIARETESAFNENLAKPIPVIPAKRIGFNNE
jgi:hypothetical protein